MLNSIKYLLGEFVLTLQFPNESHRQLGILIMHVLAISIFINTQHMILIPNKNPSLKRSIS